MTGRKYDGGKPEYYLVPPRAMDAFARVLTYGKYKYGAHNWRDVIGAKERYLSAAFRHLMAHLRGERLDPESGIPHLAHAICSLMFVLDLEEEEAHDEKKPSAANEGITYAAQHYYPQRK